MARELTAHRDRLAVAGAERYSGFANGHSVTFTSSYVESDSHALDFTLSMALVEADELSHQFDENYTPRSLVTVLSADSLYLGIPMGDGLTPELDAPFYDDGQSNLCWISATPMDTVSTASGAGRRRMA
mgnify:CR=1 FL=1